MKLMEVFNNAVPWKWSSVQGDFARAEFMIDEIKYFVLFTEEYRPDSEMLNPDVDHTAIEILFGITASGKPAQFDITGTGNAFTVFATIVDITMTYLKNHNPKCFTFTAKEASRVKLYKRFAAHFKSLGWKVETGYDQEDHYYWIFTK